MLHKMLTELLRKEMIPALGCTGPTAYALATACCRPYLTAKPKEVKVRVSPAFLKIGFGVATPGTTSPGIEIAAAAGLIAGDYTLGLQVLKPVTQADMEAAAALVKEGIIQVLCAWDQTGVYVRAEVTTENEEVLAVVEHTHDGISLIQVNGEKKLERPPASEERVEDNTDFLTLENIFTYVRTVDPADIRFLLDGYYMNLKLAEDGLKQSFGLASGRAYLTDYWKTKGLPSDLFEKPMEYLPDNIHDRARILVSAASDGRMGGSRLPAMAAMGDGNQGLTAMIPVGVTAELMGANEEKTCRALALSSLMLFYVKVNVGRAAAFCLCAIAASAGAAAGMAYLRDMTEAQIKSAVKNVISPLAGMLCDGAKNGCALKMAIAVSSAFSAVELAADGVQVGFFDGVSDDTLEDTVTCITEIASRSMELLDHCMVDGILCKTERKRAAATAQADPPS